MKSSLWQNCNHLCCRSFIITRPSLSISNIARYMSRYEADLAVSVAVPDLGQMRPCAS